ncbi:hypothetical protein ABH931_004207 [Streptacidiphilus sp. MAP12-33]
MDRLDMVEVVSGRAYPMPRLRDASGGRWQRAEVG